MGLFLGSTFCSIDLCVYPFANTTLALSVLRLSSIHPPTLFSNIVLAVVSMGSILICINGGENTQERKLSKVEIKEIEEKGNAFED